MKHALVYLNLHRSENAGYLKKIIVHWALLQNEHSPSH